MQTSNVDAEVFSQLHNHDVKLETAAQYEEAKTEVISSGITMKDNPSYQPGEVAGAPSVTTKICLSA